MAVAQPVAPVANQDGASLSVVIPAYNEADRIEQTLREVVAWANVRTDLTEIIVVDDGSTDETVALARDLARGNAMVRVVAEPHRGKAGTVRAGFGMATGSVVLFTDADLATPIWYADELVARITAGADVAIASREGAGAQRLGEPGHRHIMGRVFNLIVQALLLPGIQDTQCGFKAFRAEAARGIFAASLLHRSDLEDPRPRVTAFDVELLYVARRLGYTIAVVPVVWSAGTGSKVNPIRDTWINVLDIVHIRLNAWRGRYSSR
ncbi:MAG TPA: dolichyl-phosphate beta-glucosyltransferase [Thermomicrobiales bacterium]|jgi:glycosyltransferase involved in cell wall biosynthesis|nr:dolichyl-phosphate beta-glucosyltransferase [Thermomicrobiales bacterium]